MERGRQFRVVTQAFSAAAGLLALAGVAVAVLASSASAGFVLALGAFLLAAAIYASGNAAVHYDRSRESDAQRSRRRAISLAVTLFLGAVLATLLLVEVLAVLTGLGYFRFFGEGPRLVVRFFAVPVGLILALFSGAVALRTFLPGEASSRRKRPVTGYAGLAVAVLTVLLALTINGGVAQSLGITDSPPNRAPFVLGLAFFPLYLALQRCSSYPAPRAAVRALGSRLRTGERDLGQVVLVAGSMAVLATVALAAFVNYGVGMTVWALGLSGAGVALLLALPVGVGFARVVEEIEETRSDYEARRRRRRVALWGATAVQTVLALAALAVGIAGPILGHGSLLAAHFPALAVLLAVAAVAGVAVRTRVQAEDEYKTWRKVVGSQLIAAVAVLAFLGVFLAAEMARGPIVGAANGAAVLAVAWGLGLLYVKNRLLLPSLVERTVTWYQSREEEIRQDLEPDEAVERSMWAAYLASVGVALVGVGVMALMFFDVIPQPSATGTQVGLGGIWILVIFVVAGVGAFRHLQRRNIETVQTQDDEEQVVGERRFKRHEIIRYSILGFSITFALALFVTGALVMAGVVTSLAGRPVPARFATDFFVFGLLSGLGPYGFFHAREQKRIRAMDERLPEFLRDLAESKRAGMTLTEAIITASRGNYGELTPEVRKMAAQLEWGVSFTEALTRFSERVDTPLVERTVNLIVEASNAGGNVVDVLGAAADDAREIRKILQERRDSMVVYVMIIYVAFLVFLGVIAVLNAQFLPEISEAVGQAAESGAPSIGGLQFTQVDTQAYQTLFFHAAVIQGLGGGLVAGVMRGGKPVEGLKHSFIMILIAYVAFRVFIGV